MVRSDSLVELLGSCTECPAKSAALVKSRINDREQESSLPRQLSMSRQPPGACGPSEILLEVLWHQLWLGCEKLLKSICP